MLKGRALEEPCPEPGSCLGKTGALSSAAAAPPLPSRTFTAPPQSPFDLSPPMDEAEQQSGKATWVRILLHFPSGLVPVPSLPLSWRTGALCATASVFTWSLDKISEEQRGEHQRVETGHSCTGKGWHAIGQEPEM